MQLRQKEELVSKLRDRFQRCSCVIMSDFHRMDVATMEKLRHEIKSKGCEFMVVKNTILRKATLDLPFARDIEPYLKGMSAVTWSGDDPAATVKILRDFQKEDARLKIKCGILEGKILNPEGVEQLIDMPTKAQARATLIGLLTVPVKRLLALMEAPATNFLYLLNGYSKLKS